MGLFPPEEYTRRQALLAAELAVQEIDLAILTHPPDILYLSGTCQASCLFLPKSGDPLLASRRGAERARAEAAARVKPFRDSAGLAALALRACGTNPRRAALAFDVCRHDQALRWRKLLPEAEIVDCAAVLRSLRQIKSPAEAALIRLAGRQLDGALKTAASLLRLGQSELELCIRIEAYLRRKGHPGLVRIRRPGFESGMGFALAGQSTLPLPETDAICTGPGLSPAVPLGPGDREFRPGEPVLMDYLGSCGGYLADQTRMLSLGPPPAEASWAYEAMRQVLRRIEGRLGPGEEAGAIFQAACREARLLGYEDSFMGGEQAGLRFVGHGLGLELDEPPYLAQGQKTRLAPGMVVAVEPKVVLPGLGVVGIENTYLVTEGGFECLTPATEDWRQVPVD